MSTTLSRDVFLSYASQDVDVAERICDALRACKVGVWFDKDEIAGGDLWDQKIRQKILNCSLFMPIISANSERRLEGYFRHEWKIAVERTRNMADGLPFLMPVVIDETIPATARVPETFHGVQWTTLTGGQVSPKFLARVQQLLSSETPAESPAQRPHPPRRADATFAGDGPSWLKRHPRVLVSSVLAALLLTLLAVFGTLEFKTPSRIGPPADTARQSPVPEIAKLLPRDPAAPVQPLIGERSIAVLPFVDMSEKKNQEYFSDGLSEELINQLSMIPDLQVISHTSSFYFKGRQTMISEIAKQLGVRYVLEGGVRASRGAIRVTARLIRADNGSDVWSDSYDRALKDLFEVQSEIAGAVVHALKAKFASAERPSSRRTASSEAYQEYLIGVKLSEGTNSDDWSRAVAKFRRATALDPNFAAAYAAVVSPETQLADLAGDSKAILQAQANAEKAITLAPDEVDGYVARAFIRETWTWDWAGAQADYAKALTLEPTRGKTLADYAYLLTDLGRFGEAEAALRKSIDYDPLAADAWANLGRLQMFQNDFRTAHDAYSRCLELQPRSSYCVFDLGLLQLLENDAGAALETFKQASDPVHRLSGTVMAEHSLGHAKESELALKTLVTEQAQGSAYQIAETYAWVGDRQNALLWLERAFEQRDGGLAEIKGDLLLASLRREPRFLTIVRNMNLPL